MKTFENLIIFEMANNHMGSISHGFKIIDEYAKLIKNYKKNFKFAFKLQYRDLDTFIHPKMKNRKDVPYIKRFLETRISKQKMNSLIKHIKKRGFKAISTPFDENSVDLVYSQKLDYVKVASCSYNDWPLLEKISLLEMPIIISTAGAKENELEKVVAFFYHRKKNFALMHCVGEYPTPDHKMNLGRITLLKNKFPSLSIGYSSHENPQNTENIKIAYGAGARIFEKHVGFPTNKYSNNKYSLSTSQTKRWIESLLQAQKVFGSCVKITSNNIKESLAMNSLQRGVFVKNKIKKGKKITPKDVYFAFPPKKNQLTANNFSKYLNLEAKKNIDTNEDINSKNTNITNNHKKIYEIIKKIKILLDKSNIILPKNISLEISHHYGLKNFYKTGLTMITLVNNEYCKKILIMLPNQSHPEQFHKLKKETFLILFGEVVVKLDNKPKKLFPGDKLTILPGQKHFFSSGKKGAIIEEISSTHKKSDSYYTDNKIQKNNNRKTIVNHWL